MISIAMYFSLWTGICTLVWSYGINGYSTIAWVLFIFGIIWTLGLTRRWMWTADFALIFFTLATAAGIYLSLPFGWMLTGSLGALLTHDLSAFAHRLDNTAQEQGTRHLERAHFVQLGMFLLLAITLSFVPILWQTQMSFEWTIIFVLVIIWGFSKLLGWLRQAKR